MTPVSPEPICEASRIRCASPPESVSAERSSARYSRPTLLRNASRVTISLMIRSAIAAFWPGRTSCPKYAAASLSGSPETSKIARASAPSPTLTCRASRRSRVPSHSGHGARVQILRELLAHHQRVGLAVAALEIGNDPFERVLARHRLAAIGQVGERNLLAAAAEEDHLLDPLGQPRERPLEIESDVLREAPEHLEVELVAPIPALDGAGRERELRKGDDALRIEEGDRAEPVAARTRAHRIVEREEPRLELGERVVADRTRELRRKEMLRARRVCVIHLDGDRAAVADAQRRLVRFGEPLLHVGTHAQPVDDDLDRVLGVLREPRHRVDLVHRPVDADADEAFRAQFDEELELLALAVDDDRRDDHQLRVLRERERRVDHLRDRHRRELLLRMVGAVGIAHARIEKPQVIVDLGDGAHRRARVVRGRLLLDRDRRREPLDQVDVGLLHELQELPRVRRQRFDVAALAFRVQRVERERALAGAGETGDDDQPVARQIEVDVLEVVRACTANADVFHRS